MDNRTIAEVKMTDSRLIYSLDCLPTLQNRVFDSVEAARACQTGSLRIVQDSQTGLLHNSAFDPDKLAYDSNYNNEQSLSGAFQAHLQQVQKLIAKHLGTRNLLEVGCGKAYFLEMLRASGMDVAGCDPTYEGTNAAIIKDFYTTNIGIANKNIILRHVLEHIPDPVSFLRKLHSTNGGGKIYIEVPCMDWIANHGAWFDLFYEHVNYFRLTDLNAIFGTVFESGRIFGGQYLYIIADLASIKTPVRSSEDVFQLPSTCIPSFRTFQPGRINVVWGAASKGVIYSLLASRAEKQIHLAIDVNPAKQNKFLPVTGIPVISPLSAMETLPADAHILIMNSNYRDEIIAMCSGKFSFSAVDNDQL